MRSSEMSPHATPEQLKVAFESTELSSNENNMDRLRALFASKERQLGQFPQYAPVQFLGSPYLLRGIRSQLSLKETIKGLSYAQNSGIASLYGWHFELHEYKLDLSSCERRIDETEDA
jgi:hypothetical protein